MPEHPLDRLERVAEDVVRQAEWERDNRRGLLWVHGIVGLLAGVQMALWGSATTIETAVGPWSRGFMSMLGTLGGLILIAGLLQRPRSVLMESIGLAAMWMWDLAMTLGLAYARLHQHDFHVIPWTEPLPAGYVVAYASTIYAGYLALLTIHLSTLRKMRRVKR